MIFHDEVQNERAKKIVESLKDNTDQLELVKSRKLTLDVSNFLKMIFGNAKLNSILGFGCGEAFQQHFNTTKFNERTVNWLAGNIHSNIDFWRENSNYFCDTLTHITQFSLLRQQKQTKRRLF